MSRCVVLITFVWRSWSRTPRAFSLHATRTWLTVPGTDGKGSSQSTSDCRTVNLSTPERRPSVVEFYRVERKKSEPQESRQRQVLVSAAREWQRREPRCIQTFNALCETEFIFAAPAEETEK